VGVPAAAAPHPVHLLKNPHPDLKTLYTKIRFIFQQLKETMYHKSLEKSGCSFDNAALLNCCMKGRVSTDSKPSPPAENIFFKGAPESV